MDHQLCKTSLLLASPTAMLRQAVLAELRTTDPDMFGRLGRGRLFGIILLLEEPRPAADVPQQKATGRPSGRDRFGTQYGVALEGYRVSPAWGAQAHAGQVTVRGGREPIVVLQLTINRYLALAALVKKSIRFVNAADPHLDLAALRCTLREIDDEFLAFSEILQDADSCCPLPKEIGGYVRHLKAALERRGIDSLIKGDLRTGLYLDTDPNNVTFIPGVDT